MEAVLSKTEQRAKAADQIKKFRERENIKNVSMQST